MSEASALYSSLFGREADADGLAFWESTGLTGDALETAFLNSATGSDRTSVLETQYDNQFGRDYGSGDEYWMGDDAWNSATSNGLDTLTRTIAGSSVGSDEFSLLNNLGLDQGNTWSQALYEPEAANQLWEQLMDADGLNMDLLTPSIDQIPTSTASANTYEDYLNPYLGEVLDNSIDAINEQGEIRRNMLGTQAFSAGAYGDARHGVEGANITKDMLDTVGDLSAQIHAQGYESAMGWLNQDLNTQMNLALQNASLQNNWLTNNASLAQTGNQFGLNDIAATTSYLDTLTNVDQYDRNWLQNQYNADYQDFWDRENWDQNNINGLLSAINSIPGQVGSTSSSSTYMPDTSSFAGIGSFLQSALSGDSSIVPAI